jgi:L-threonylcarbamoyladenylate synthase
VRPDPVGEAVDWVRDGGLLGYPTETVWGLGADASSESALEALRVWKGRDASSPIAILVPDVEALDALQFEPNEAARRLTAALWPGPLTLVMPCRARFAPGIAREDGAVGVRCSSHPLCASIARRLADAGAGPMTATSLNAAGETAARTVDEARAVCERGDPRPRLVDVDGAEAGGDLESTVIDLTGAEPRILRWGTLSRFDLEPVLQEIPIR